MYPNQTTILFIINFYNIKKKEECSRKFGENLKILEQENIIFMEIESSSSLRFRIFTRKKLVFYNLLVIFGGSIN